MLHAWLDHQWLSSSLYNRRYTQPERSIVWSRRLCVYTGRRVFISLFSVYTNTPGRFLHLLFIDIPQPPPPLVSLAIAYNISFFFFFFSFFALCAGHWYILFKRTQYIARKMYCRYRTDPLRIIASSVHHYTFFLLLFYDSVAVAEECLVVALLICLLVFVAVSVGTTNKNRQ